MENAAETTNGGRPIGIDVDKLVVMKSTTTNHVWFVGDVVERKDFLDARATLRYAIQTIQDQLAQDDTRPADWRAKARKALRLKRLALEVLEDRFGGSDHSEDAE